MRGNNPSPFIDYYLTLACVKCISVRKFHSQSLCCPPLQAKVVEAKTGPNLSLKLQLRDLHSKFPDLEQSMVNETLVRNK